MKKKEEQKIIRRQVSKKLQSLSQFKKEASAINSWSKYVRVALGMTVSQMAKRMGLAQSTMTESEKQEEAGTLTINKLKKMAEALDCDLVYAFIPKTSLEDTIENEARKKVLKSLKEASVHMALEDQAVIYKNKGEREERINELVEEKKYSKYLWDEEC